MGFIITYNDPLNPIIHGFYAMYILKPEMKNIHNFLSIGGIFEDNNFQTPYYICIQYLLVWLKILGQEQLMAHFTQ